MGNGSNGEFWIGVSGEDTGSNGELGTVVTGWGAGINMELLTGSQERAHVAIWIFELVIGINGELLNGVSGEGPGTRALVEMW